MIPSSETVTRETPSSVEIGRNSKHEPVWTVKVYCAVGDEEQALERAIALDTRLQAHYWGELP
jgi:hypothetical protein